jgi:hypothetical protein
MVRAGLKKSESMNSRFLKIGSATPQRSIFLSEQSARLFVDFLD